MPNVTTVIKDEFARIARKEVRAEMQSLKTSFAQFRADLLACKRKIAALEKQMSRAGRRVVVSDQDDEDFDDPTVGLRFSAKGFATKRRRLGLSAAEMGALIGVSGQSIYKWEDGKARPRARQLPAIAQVRKLGKKQAFAKLAALAAGGKIIADDAEN